MEAFLLAPFALGSQQRNRELLLKRRNEWMALGITNDDMSPAMQLDYIRCGGA